MVVAGDSNMDFVTMDVQNLMVRASKKGKLSKSLSKSMPSIAHTGQSLLALSSSTSSISMMTASRSSERKFHRYFKQVPIEEHVLVHYRCALVRDILLQGHLYITPNHFAFYSNVFGYITKLLIPIGSIIEISKQKKVKFVPNAVGITTKDEKHVFGSLFWKDSAFERMKQIWDDMTDRKSATADIPPCHEGQLLDSEDPQGDNSEDNYDENDSGILANETGQTSPPSTTRTETDGFPTTILRPPAIVMRLQSHFKPNTIIAILVVLLAVLFVSATVMMMRIDRLHTAYLTHPLVSPNHAIKRHFSQYVKQNLDQIVRARENLEQMCQHFVSISKGTGNGQIPDDVLDLKDAPS